MTRFAALALALSLFPTLLSAQELERAKAEEAVKQLVQERLKKPFRNPRESMPDELKGLDYDRYREIRFRRSNALWAAEKLPFWAEFFHPGYIYQEPVQINEFTDTHVQRVRFVREFFDYSKLELKDRVPTDLGYAGWRVLHPLNEKEVYDELGVFQGASYFRLLGKDMHYGLSARGLAIDTGEGDRSEEFPLFSNFWLGKPKADAKELTVHALLDSASCVGSYRFVFRPGATTSVEVEATLYFRAEAERIDPFTGKPRPPLKTLGLAPLTSMFWYGENSQKPDDFRPEVHDTDGLLLHMSTGEVLWRPLESHPKQTRRSVFATRDLRGFGLMQRDRDFDHYQDLAAEYHRRPSLFIKPKGDWGEGEIHLVELDTVNEYKDNVVAFWNPKEKPRPGEPLHFAYEMLWTKDRLSDDYVRSTRLGADLRDPKLRQIVIDFAGSALSALDKDAPVKAVVSCSANAHIADNLTLKNAVDGTWRVMLKLAPEPETREPVDLRCTLQLEGKALCETWSYLWSPP